MIDYSIENRSYRKGQRVRVTWPNFKGHIGTIIFFDQQDKTFLVSFDQKTVDELGHSFIFHKGRTYDDNMCLVMIHDSFTCRWVYEKDLEFLDSDNENFNDEEYESMLV